MKVSHGTFSRDCPMGQLVRPILATAVVPAVPPVPLVPTADKRTSHK
jgi:hypothetical protein